jgi:hypothetical protein
MRTGPFGAVSVEFSRPGLKAMRGSGGATNAEPVDPPPDFRELAARELSMLANAPLTPNRRRRLR